MRRRAVARNDSFPEHLACYDWREWRPLPEPDDPSPWYTAWYLGLGDWQAARRAWAAERGVPVRLLPRHVFPPTPDLLAASEPKPGQATNTPPIRETSGEAASPRVNRAKSVPRARPIKLY